MASRATRYILVTPAELPKRPTTPTRQVSIIGASGTSSYLPIVRVEGEEKMHLYRLRHSKRSQDTYDRPYSSDWIIDKEPTTEEEGLKHKELYRLRSVFRL